jgi:hypothetical protein
MGMPASEQPTTAPPMRETVEFTVPEGYEGTKVSPDSLRRLTLQCYVFLASGGEEREASRRLRGYERHYGE